MSLSYEAKKPIEDVNVNTSGASLLAEIHSAAGLQEDKHRIPYSASGEDAKTMAEAIKKIEPERLATLWKETLGLHDMDLPDFNSFVSDWISFLENSNGYEAF